MNPGARFMWHDPADDRLPPLTAQDANRALGLDPNTVGVRIEHRFNLDARRWEVRLTAGAWVAVDRSGTAPGHPAHGTAEDVQP